VPVDEQGEFESEHLWQHVSAAIARDDQVNTVFDPVVITCMFRNVKQVISLACRILA